MRAKARIGYACRLAGVVLAALLIAACSRDTQPHQYGLGGEGPAAPGSARDFAVNVGDVVHFQVDSWALTGEAQSILRNQARWLNQYPQYSMTIEGRADERGTRECNLALGARRATTVKSFLARSGVNGGHIRTISYGKERPVATCDDISCWSQNRRAQTVLNNQAVARNY